MLKINEEIYHNELTTISWTEYTKLENGIKNTILCPCLDFNVTKDSSDVISILIETTLSKKVIDSIEIQSEININIYISEVLYSINNTLIYNFHNNFESRLMRKNLTTFNFKLDFKELNIYIDCDIIIEY